MTIPSLDVDKLLETVMHIRKSKLDPRIRREIVDELIRTCQLIVRQESGHLVCIKHAKETRGYANHSSVYRQLPRLPLHNYKVCCREFFDRKELEALPPKGDYTSRVIKVGMKR